MTSTPVETEARSRTWRPDHPVELAGVLGPLRRGSGDPAFQSTVDGVCWLAGNTPTGIGTLAVRAAGTVAASAWGPGADWLLDALPALLGAEDDDTGFVAHHPLIADTRRRQPGLRLGTTGRVWDVLVSAVLEQKVTGYEARRSWRELARRFGTRAPGPAPTGMHVPPDARAVARIRDWEWHKAGVDGARRRTLIAAASVAPRLERAATLRGEEGRALLRKVPGIGVWTAAEVAQRAWGDPDAVSVGDLHVPGVVGWALVGHDLDDDGMLEVLAPYAPQRQRAVRYIEASGFRRPRFASRYSVRDYRSF
jgi:3-methyladenine DNA glycosylase/8-oxoguanine DNA glycosylase